MHHSSTGPQPDRTTSDALTHALFDPDDFGAVHEPWRHLIGTERFRYDDSLSDHERIAQSYRRLHDINEALSRPFALAEDPIRLAGLHEWIAIADPATASLASIHHNLFLGSMAEANQHFTVDHTHTGVFLVTELGAGCNAAELRTTATWDPTTDTFDLHTPDAGARKFMPNTGPIGGPKDGVVAARLQANGSDHGVFLFHLPITDPTGHPHSGIDVHTLPSRSGNNPLDHSLTTFHHVRLRRSALLEGDHGHLAWNGTFTSAVDKPRARFLRSIRRVTAGKLAMSAGCLGLARAAMDLATRYAHHRYIPGRSEPLPIVSHRTHAERLATCISTVYALTCLHRHTLHAWAAHDQTNRDDLERDVALAKATITWAAHDIVTEARERCGAHGILLTNALGGMAEAISGAITAEGDNLAITVKAAGELLSADALLDATADHQNFVVASLDEQTPLQDLCHLLACARDLLAISACSRFMTTDAKGLERWNSSSRPAVDAATLHTAVQTGNAFRQAVDDCHHPQAKTLLHDMSRLFLLRQLTPHTTALISRGNLTEEAALTLPEHIDNTVDRLTPTSSPSQKASRSQPTTWPPSPSPTPTTKTTTAAPPTTA
ncbi:acyl-CoA dehydrogenase family protein [Streptomyces noursei]|uniref:acyl-CoA dehydrogenase family protein n=1 Tax=Streptomyces noursei TaxID=1971 RepID=UPI000C9C5EDC|nr:acyl-CoA dehydrogenase family protein [Streptomyces noursei]